MLENISLTLAVKNNVNYPVSANVLGSNIDLLDTSNNNIEYRWDVTSFLFAGENTVSVQYKANNDAFFSTFIQDVFYADFTAVIDALNKLGIGFFSYYSESGSNYIGTYNNDYTFGDLNLYVSSVIDQTFLYGTGFDNQTNQSLILGNGGAIYVGVFTNYNSNSLNYFAFVNPDGSVNTSYNIGAGFDADVWSIAQQSNGSYALGGQFANFDGTATSNLISLYPSPQVNGSTLYNSNFIYGSGFSGGLINCIVVQSDGKIIYGGIFTTYNGNSCPQNIIRLNSDGSVDNTFNAGTGFNGNVNYLALQSDGKIVVCGSFLQYGVNVAICICRINADGTYDSTFDTTSSGFNFGAVPNCLQIQNDGKILVGGSFTSYKGNASSNIVRINSNASYDSTFSVGTGFDFSTNSIKIQTDGKILVGGAFTNYSGNSTNRIVRINTNGSIDNTFSIGTGFNGNVSFIELQSSGKVIVTGQFTFYDGGNSCNRIARLNTNGSFDSTFNIGVGLPILTQGRCLSVQSDDKIYIGGTFTAFNSVSAKRIVRLNSDGSVDTTWDTSNAFNSDVRFISLDEVNNILYTGGGYTFYDTTSANSLASLYIIPQDVYGLLNTSFNNNVLTYLPNTYRVYNIIQTSNNQLIASGNFTTIGGNYITIMRVNFDGTLDTTFSSSISCNGFITPIALQQNGKIIAGGTFTNYQGQTSNYIMRLDENGLFDTTFNIGSGFDNAVTAITVLSNNKILVGGQFTSFDGNSCVRIARLNSDGSFDSTFNSGTGFNNYINSIVELGDGTYLIGGEFTLYNSNTHNYIVRLNNDGTVFYDWNEGTGFDASVTNISPTNVNGSVFVCGTFTSFNGTAANRTILLSV